MKSKYITLQEQQIHTRHGHYGDDTMRISFLTGGNDVAHSKKIKKKKEKENIKKTPNESIQN